MIKCCKCFHDLEDSCSFCVDCGAKIDKAKHEDSLKAKKEIIEALEQIIADLEYYGKLRISCSLVSKIVSKILLWTLPGTSFATVAYFATICTKIINRGVSLFTVWKNRRLLMEAGKICKEDFDIDSKRPKFGDGEDQNDAYKLAFFAEYVPILQDLLALYRGDYSADAKQLKVYLKKLKEEWFPEEHDC